MTRAASHWLVVLVACLALLLLGAAPSGGVLPPRAGEDFSRLVGLINAEARLGPSIHVTGVRILRTGAELRLTTAPDGPPVTISLAHSSAPDAKVRSRWFALITPQGDLSEPELRALATLLDEVFTDDPFVDPSTAPHSDAKDPASREFPLARALTRERARLNVALLALVTAFTIRHVLRAARRRAHP